MARIQNFHGRRVILPGVYTKIKSGINSSLRDLDYGRILIIDTSSGKEFGGGAGIDGEFSKDKDSIYEFDDITSYRDFLKGGLLWSISAPLFNPEPGEVGVSKVYHVKAATTTAATINIDSTNSTFALKVLDEGLIGNGSVDATSKNLVAGYAFKLESGRADKNKFILKFYLSSYKGDFTDGKSFNEVTKKDAKPNMILESPEVSTSKELNNWMDSSSVFKSLFHKETYTEKTTPGTFVSGDLSTEYEVAAGGTESYTSDNLDKVFASIADLDYSFILCDNFGGEAKNAMNGKILAHIKDQDTRFDKYMVVAAGKDRTEFATGDTSSIPVAKYYNDDNVIVVHGAEKATFPSGLRQMTQLHTAAKVLGRMCGLPPQVPITFKSINMDGLAHNLTLSERRAALQAGVLTVIRDEDFGSFIVEQGINSLQNNEQIMTANDESYSIQIKRIAAQLNKEIFINAKLDLLGQRDGVNRNTLTAQNVQDYVKGYLQRKVATENVDNLLISFEGVVTRLVGGAYHTTYGFTPNGEINQLFFTGFMLE